MIGNTTAAGSGVELAAGDNVQVWSDGTNFYGVKAQNLTGLVPISNGGTGQITANAAFNALAPAQTATVTAGSFIVGSVYTILTIGTTDFTLIGASSNTVGLSFIASGAGTGTGTATIPVPNRYLKSNGVNTSWDYINLSDASTVSAGSFSVSTAYTVKTLGTTDFVAVGAAASAIGVGSVTTTVLTVASVSSGAFAVGTYVTGTGISSGTYITSFGTGSGGAGTYNLNQAVGSPTGSITVTGQPIPGTPFVATGVGSGSGTATLADFIGTLPVANGGTGTATSTGSGSVVLATSPSLTTPTLTSARVPGSSTGYTTIASANTGATNYTVTLPTENFTVGFRNIPPVGTQTGAYTLTVNDVGKYVQIGSGGSVVIPNNVFSEGDVVSVFNNTSSNATITCSISTAYISGLNTVKTSMTLVTRGVATILFISGTLCVVSGLVS